MKRLLTLFILAILAGAPQAFCNQTETEKDSLLQILDTLPANASRLETLYELAYLDPMSPSCAYYLGNCWMRRSNRMTNITNALPCTPM